MQPQCKNPSIESISAKLVQYAFRTCKLYAIHKKIPQKHFYLKVPTAEMEFKQP